MLPIGTNTKARVFQALTNSGYGTDGILSASFQKMTGNGDQEMHRITFRNEDTGGYDAGFVYVTFKDGKVYGEF